MFTGIITDVGQVLERRGGARGEEPLESVVGAQFVQHEVDQFGADQRQGGEVRPRVLDMGTFQQDDGAAVGFREPNIADDAAFLEVPNGRGFGAEQVPEIAMHGAGQFPFDGEDAHGVFLRFGWRVVRRAIGCSHVMIRGEGFDQTQLFFLAPLHPCALALRITISVNL